MTQYFSGPMTVQRRYIELPVVKIRWASDVLQVAFYVLYFQPKSLQYYTRLRSKNYGDGTRLFLATINTFFFQVFY